MQLDTNEINIDGTNLKVAIILPYFNETLGLEMLENTKNELIKNKVKENNIKVIRVAGALEIPYAAQKVTEVDTIIALGIIIRGDTGHYDQVCQTTFNGLMKVQLEKKIPISFGILTCENEQQAKVRASKDGLNKGKLAAQAALIQTQLP